MSHVVTLFWISNSVKSCRIEMPVNLFALYQIKLHSVFKRNLQLNETLRHTYLIQLKNVLVRTSVFFSLLLLFCFLFVALLVLLQMVSLVFLGVQNCLCLSLERRQCPFFSYILVERFVLSNISYMAYNFPYFSRLRMFRPKVDNTCQLAHTHKKNSVSRFHIFCNVAKKFRVSGYAWLLSC